MFCETNDIVLSCRNLSICQDHYEHKESAFMARPNQVAEKGPGWGWLVYSGAIDETSYAPCHSN